jgi:hypothetical protein
LFAALTVSCAAWTKNEGQLFLALVIFVYFIGQLGKKEWSKTIKEFIGFTLGLAPVLATLFFCICCLSWESERSLECFAAEDYNSTLANMGLSFLLLRQGAGKKCCHPGYPHPFLQG